MKRIRIEPITILRDTNKISELCHKEEGPIFITKNGTNDLVIMSDEVYNEYSSCENYKVESHELRNIESSVDHSDSLNFIRVGCHTFDIALLNVTKNIESIKVEIKKGWNNKEKVMVFSELCLTGYTCGDMFLQDSIILKSYDGLMELVDFTKGIRALIIVGLPMTIDNRNYNVAAIINDGKLVGIVPKSFLPSYKEFYEQRQFSSGSMINSSVLIKGVSVPFGTDLLFVAKNNTKIKIGVEICEDLWSYESPNIRLASSGASIICNLSASNEVVSKDDYRKNLIEVTSKKLNIAYVYTSSGSGESTTDLIYGGRCYIYENGKELRQKDLFDENNIFADVDLDSMLKERISNTSLIMKNICRRISVDLDVEDIYEEYVEPHPFLCDEKEYQRIINLQAHALAFRLKHINARPVLGLSGGLDSTLALIVCLEAMKILKKDSKEVIAISMPAKATSRRTKSNAEKLAELTNVDFRVINIESSIAIHLSAIGHDENTQDITYENAQARERTKILMDVANMTNGMVIGTGDLSEACLGWSTYNGDHMSNYAVNISIPKTLVKELVRYYANTNKHLFEVLLDIVDTPISPELKSDGQEKIVQKTEDIIGPYELHDFFIFHILINGYGARKVFFMACLAFKEYDKKTILKWLKIFYRRFISMQFKRSCLPDGVKVTRVSISPRGDLRMPSDASSKVFLDELSEIEKNL